MDSRKPWMALSALGLTAFIIWLDGATSAHLDLILLYLLPIGVATWFVGLWLGVSISLLIASGLFLHPHFSAAAFPRAAVFWNTAVALCIFLVVSWLLQALRRSATRDRLASRLKSEMLSAVSHEFLNMLTIMKGALAILEQGKSSPEEQKSLHGMLKGAYSVLQQTSENFLNHARMESGRFELRLDKTCLNRTIEDTLVLLRPLSDGKGLTVRFLPPVKELCVSADRAALALVLQNLVGNAIKYSPEGTGVEVAVGLPEDGSGFARVSVQDHGIGIAPEEQEKVFSGFYRASKGKGVAKGFGVGLKVSREIVEDHGGRLEIESRPGEGARFTFSLPCLGVCDHRIPLR